MYMWGEGGGVYMYMCTSVHVFVCVLACVCMLCVCVWLYFGVRACIFACVLVYWCLYEYVWACPLHPHVSNDLRAQRRPLHRQQKSPLQTPESGWKCNSTDNYSTVYLHLKKIHISLLHLNGWKKFNSRKSDTDVSNLSPVGMTSLFPIRLKV